VRDKTRFDILIFGAGIAGLSTAYAANRAGFKTAVIDRNNPGSGASGTPIALVNPATGRKAKKTWNAEVCLTYTRKLLQHAAIFSESRIFIENGVIRPALDHKLAEGMYNTFMQSSWSEDWAEWLEEEEVIARFPGLKCIDGGLWIPKGLTVSMNAFTHALYHYLETRGVAFFLNRQFQADSGPPFIVSSDSIKIEADIAIHCMGKDMVDNPNWKILPLHQVKGQTLTLKLSEPLQFKSSVSSLGYIAQSTNNNKTIVLGSTYEHQFDHLRPDTKGEKYLLNRLQRTLPGIYDYSRVRTGWAGVRVTVPDKKPVAGKHPEIDQLYTLCALGSKGLILGPLLGKLLIDSIKDQDEIPEIFSIERLFG
jgi:glycine oxidase